ncbi:GH32 C-terminal domain-containing protein [Blautia sp. An46]
MLLLIDSSIVEIFVNQGEIVFTTRIYLEKNEREISFQQWENISLETVKE